MRCFFFVLLTCAISQVSAQALKDITIDQSSNGKVLSTFLQDLEKVHDIDFVGDMNRLEALTVQGIEKPMRLLEYLDSFSGIIDVVKISEKVIVLADKNTLKNTLTNTKPQYLVLSEGSHGSITGTVSDAHSQSTLTGAQLYFPVSKKGTAADENGQFSISTPNTPLVVAQVKFAGYDAETLIIGWSKYATETRLTVKLFQTSKELEGVTVTAERINENVVSQISGVEHLSIETIKTIPTFMGEVDPIRSLTTLPGVSTAGELASGFNVRGGESGQNLVLQDGATIYNPSHLFGFFSAFNPDMVSDITLYKGAGPASFGSRISSVLNVSLKKGDATRHSVSGGVGPVTSRLTVQGPLIKNKSSYMIGGRISYVNWLLHATDDIRLKRSAANFHDITAKVLHTFNDKNFITLSVYNSYDDFRLETDSVFSWQTFNATLKWDHTFSDKWYSTVAVTSSNYRSDVESQDEIEKFSYYNAIQSFGGRFDLTYAPVEETKFVTGLESTMSRLEPGKLTPAEESHNIPFQDMQDQRMIESALFIQGDAKLTDRLSVSAGLRYSYFVRLGREDIYTYDYNNMNGRYPSVVDTVHYASGAVISTYDGLEPRLSVRFLVTPSASMKASYYRGYQYVHLISNTTSTTPQDYWVASGPMLKPQMGDQYSLGYFQNFADNLFEFSLEGFYKTIDNAVDYIEGADITLNPILEAGLSQGKGKAYGGELFLKKTRGKFNGWLSYTYSRSLRKFDGQEATDIVINEGKYYASAFDQPHNVSLVLNYRVGVRGFFATNFHYSTGRPITIPVSKFSYDVYLSVLNYSQRNEYRIPDYHRLDISFTLKDRPHKLSRYRSEWVFSVFNVYGRKNAYSISFDRYGKAKKLSVLGSVFPSITYNFSF
ncbi:TonB-dependent receptor [Chryseolinea sp. T2]|uniref:TonB-dependent receptor n=1 Tax=Chryseolinea sp. T2 TaxID=3129255 RepID=UPI0030787D3C